MVRPRICACGTCRDCRRSATLRRRFAAGELTPKIRGDAWTPEQEDRLASLLERYVPMARIAALLGRRESAVQARAHLLHLRVLRADGYPLGTVAAMLGVGDHTVARWVRCGWLAARQLPIRFGQGFARVVQHEALLAFLTDECYWHLWEPERITDSALREWALELRQGVRFVGTREAARLLFVSEGRINQLIHQGKLPAAKGMRGPNWRLRVDQLVLPEWEPRRRGAATTPEHVAFIRTWWGQRTATWIAEQLGLSDAVIHKLARRQELPHLGRGSWKRVQQRERAG